MWAVLATVPLVTSLSEPKNYQQFTSNTEPGSKVAHVTTAQQVI
jgi:hypothetical protein